MSLNKTGKKRSILSNISPFGARPAKKMRMDNDDNHNHNHEIEDNKEEKMDPKKIGFDQLTSSTKFLDWQQLVLILAVNEVKNRLIIWGIYEKETSNNVKFYQTLKMIVQPNSVKRTKDRKIKLKSWYMITGGALNQYNGTRAVSLTIQTEWVLCQKQKKTDLRQIMKNPRFACIPFKELGGLKDEQMNNLLLMGYYLKTNAMGSFDEMILYDGLNDIVTIQSYEVNNTEYKIGSKLYFTAIVKKALCIDRYKLTAYGPIFNFECDAEEKKQHKPPTPEEIGENWSQLNYTELLTTSTRLSVIQLRERLRNPSNYSQDTVYRAEPVYLKNITKVFKILDKERGELNYTINPGEVETVNGTRRKFEMDNDRVSYTLKFQIHDEEGAYVYCNAYEEVGRLVYGGNSAKTIFLETTPAERLAFEKRAEIIPIVMLLKYWISDKNKEKAKGTGGWTCIYIAPYTAIADENDPNYLEILQ